MAVVLMESNSFSPLSTDNTSMWHKNTPLNTYGNATGPVAVYSNDTGPQQGLMSLSTTLLIVDIVTCGIQPVLALLGVVGNSLTLIVILYQGFQQTTNIILFGLAVTDLLYVLFSLRSLLECFARQFDHQVALEIGLVSQARLVMLDAQLACLSRLYTCFIAVERFIVVQFPLKASRLLTKTRTLVVSGLLWVCALVSCFHCFFLFDIEEVHNPVQNKTVKVLDFSDFLKQNWAEIRFVTNFVRPFLFRYMPILLVFACSLFILRTLTQSRLQRQKMALAESSTSDQQQRQITKALLAICIVFLISNIPGVLVNLLRMVFDDVGFADVGRYQNSHKVALTISLLCMLVNSSVNFLLYIIFNQKFAATAQKVFFLCQKSN